MEAGNILMNVADDNTNIAINDKLHTWEKLENCSAPLSTFQRNTCLDLGDVVISRVFPETLLHDDRDDDEETSKEVTISNTWQFLDWYTDLSKEWVEYSNDTYESTLKDLHERREKCINILERVEEALSRLNELKCEYEKVSSKTNPLHSISLSLSNEQAKLNEIYSDLSHKLNPFLKVESVIKRLETSAIAVTSDAFLNVLDDIDNCALYFKEHESFKESASYLLKTRHCLSRALLDVKSYIISVLDTCRSIPSSISLSLALSNENNSDVMKSSKFIAQYGRFQTTASRLKPLLNELETRAEKNSEYEIALEECQKYYINLRQQIIGPSLKDSINELVTSRVGDYCSLLRLAATQLIYLSQDENKLYYQFFTKPSTAFTNFLETTCSILYDTIRPLVVHIKHMETLAEFCSILRVEILHDHTQNNACLLPFGNVAEQLLRDVQERLVFRANVYFKTDILQFKPSPGDLAYPEKLEMMKNIADEIKAQEIIALNRYDSKLSLTSIGSCGDSVRSDSRLSKCATGSSPADLHGMWYPTIRRTLVCLSRLYRCVEKPVFQGLAQEAIACCCENVKEAMQIISRNKSVLDGQLFQIKHLLILREQIAPFQVDFTATEMSLDFNQLKSAAYGLFQKQKLFSLSSNNAILEFILHGSPLLRESYLDSRKIVDKQLKSTCEAFISHATDTVTAALAAFMRQVQECKSTTPTSSLHKQTFARPEHVHDIVSESLKKIKSFIPPLLNKMELYLANPDTQFILYKPIKNNIVSTFAKMQTVVNENYETENQLLIGCPTPEQVSVLLSSTILAKRNSVDNSTK